MASSSGRIASFRVPGRRFRPSPAPPPLPKVFRIKCDESTLASRTTTCCSGSCSRFFLPLSWSSRRNSPQSPRSHGSREAARAETSRALRRPTWSPPEMKKILSEVGRRKLGLVLPNKVERRLMHDQFSNLVFVERFWVEKSIVQWTIEAQTEVCCSLDDDDFPRAFQRTDGGLIRKGQTTPLPVPTNGLLLFWLPPRRLCH
jgi:hypothetical protein